MKKMIISLALLAMSNSFAQAYDGFGDKKTGIGATFQSQGKGIVLCFEKGFNDYISFGTSLGFVFQADELPTISYVDSYGETVQVAKPEDSELFLEKIDYNIRMNGHYGKLLGLGEMMDLYGGLNIGFRNIGSQIGYRYLITDGFGFFAEANVPVYKHNAFTKKDDFGNYKDYYPFYNQFVFGVGIIISN